MTDLIIFVAGMAVGIAVFVFGSWYREIIK